MLSSSVSYNLCLLVCHPALICPIESCNIIIKRPFDAPERRCGIKMKKEEREIFCSVLSVTVSAVQCHPRTASVPLLSACNDVMYTHLIINMQP